MNKNIKNRIIAGLMIGILGAAGALTGCGTGGEATGAETPRNVAMVLSGHRYFPAVSLNSDAVYSEIYDACYTYGSFSAVVVDGDPFMACIYEISAPDANIDSTKRKQLAEGNAGQIISELSSQQGKTPEADTLTAVQMAASALRSSGNESDKTMLICDSGLSTTAVLDFASRNLIEVPAENIVEQLEAIHELPDLTGIDVVWTGLGQTCGEQDDLTEDYKHNLRSIWEASLNAGGASSVDFDDSPLSSEEPAGDLPECSTVAVIENGLDDTVAELPERALTPRQARFAPVERLPLWAAEGRTAAEPIAPYPPGIPVVAPGEVLTKKHLAYFSEIGYNREEKVGFISDQGDPAGPPTQRHIQGGTQL